MVMIRVGPYNMNQIVVSNNISTFVGACHCMCGLAAILKCWLYANLYRLPPPFAEDGRGSSGIGKGKSIGLTEGILLPAEEVDSNQSCPNALRRRRNQRNELMI